MAVGSRVRLRAVQEAKTRETRRRVVEAAGVLFVENGYLQTTVAEVAHAAAVAPRTVYLVFRSKFALLESALDVAMVGDDEPVPMIERDWFVELVDAGDAATALARLVSGSSAVIERVYPLWSVVRDGANDPELAELLRRNKRGRRDTHSRAVTHIAAKSGAQPGLQAGPASDATYALLSQETYGLLVVESGWTVPRWSGWVHARLEAELLDPVCHR